MKAQGKHALTDVICYYKMTPVMALDSVTSFYTLKTLQIHVNVCDTIQLLAGFLQCNGRKLKEFEDFKCIFILYYVVERYWVNY